MVDRQPPEAARGFASLGSIHRAALEGGVVAGSLIVVLALAVALALAGGIDQSGLLHRVLLWVTCAALCWPLCHALCAVILYLAHSLPPALIALAATCGTFFLTLLCTPIAYTAHGLFYPARAGQAPILAVYVNVTLLVSIASAIVHYVVYHVASTHHGLHGQPMANDRGAPIPDPVVQVPAVPALDQASWFFERLPAELGRDIVCVRVSGHYLDVVTTEGACRVLLPLADAVKALDDLGMQVHRSHWVAHRHVLGLIRRDNRTLLRVTGEREIPVGRNRVAHVRQALRRFGVH